MLSFTQLQQLLEHATCAGGPSFYRNHYALEDLVQSHTIENFAEWQRLRPVTKDDLIEYPFSKRSFLPIEQLDHIRTSSGTSGKPPLFSPRTKVRNMDYRLDYHDFKGAFLAFGVPMMPHWHEQFMEEHGITPRVIVFDPKEPQISIRLAKIAGVDALSVFVFHIQMVGELMKEEGITENIKFIEVTGEICSTALYRYMKQTFPNAVILQSYGASEVEDVHMGMPCKPMDGTEPLAVYHPKETHYLEIIDSHGTSLEPRVGVEGELLVTAYPGEPSAFPLIRFRIGDMIRVVEDRCPHGSWSFTVLGRAELDFVKVTGGVLRVDEIIRVLQLFPEKVTDVFEFHYIIKETDKGPLLSPILKIEMVGNPNLKELARDIEEHLRINPELTYAQGVNDGRFLPLTCEPLELTDGVHKHRWIVRH